MYPWLPEYGPACATAFHVTPGVDIVTVGTVSADGLAQDATAISKFPAVVALLNVALLARLPPEVSLATVLFADCTRVFDTFDIIGDPPLLPQLLSPQAPRSIKATMRSVLDLIVLS
jgi:hypothetical protein